MAELRKYAGACHCGEVRYEVTSDLKQVTMCNCSICSKRGLLLTFVAPEQFTLLSGEDVLSDYQFNKKHVHHLFCPACGVESFAKGTAPDGRTMYAVNVRCLDGVDLSTLTLSPFDGKSL